METTLSPVKITDKWNDKLYRVTYTHNKTVYQNDIDILDEIKKGDCMPLVCEFGNSFDVLKWWSAEVDEMCNRVKQKITNLPNFEEMVAKKKI